MGSRQRVPPGLRSSVIGGLVGLLVASAMTGVPAQDSPQASSGNPKALKYFRVLQKRPSPGYLFDRFYNAWLDTDTVEGLEGFLQATVVQTENTSNRLLLAFFYTRQGENVQALEQFRAALEKDPGSAGAWYQKALVEQRTLDFETAIQDLGRALAAAPNAELERDILQLEGRLHARNGQAAKARAAWTTLLEKHPDDEELREDLIELQLGEGLYDQALATAEALIQRTKDPYLEVMRRLRLGDIHQSAGRQEKALEAYATSLESVGSETWIEKEIIGQVEQVFRREDDITGLKSYVEKLLEEHPKRIGLRRRFVTILAELGERDQAKQAFSEILKLTPGDRSVREDYVGLLVKLELRDEAIGQLESLIALHPDDGELLVKLADLQHEGADAPAAAKTILRFLEKSDGSEYAYLRAVRLLERFEQVEAADETFKTLLSRFPESEGARDAYASYLHRHDRKEEAIATWKSLAAGGDREKVVRVARSLSSRAEYEPSFELLESRFDEFSGDAIYLKQLIDVGLRLKKFEEAWPWVRQLVALATTPADLDAAVAAATRVTEKLDRADELRQELEGSRLPQEICLLAELYELNGESKKAIAVLEDMRTAGGDEQAALFAVTQKIRLFASRQEFERAAQTTESLIGMPGGRRTANVQKAVDLYRRAFRHDKALSWIPVWKTLSPGSIAPWLTEARLHLAEGEQEAAVGVLRRATQEFEGNQEVRATLADVYAGDGKLADSARIYNQLYEEATDVSSKIRWVEDLARVAEMRGKSRALVERFEERRRTNRTSVVPLLALAEIHRVARNYEDRRRALLEASRVKPGDLELLLQIARIEESEQDFDRALASLESAVSVAGAKQDRVLERIARVHFAAGNDDKGFAVLRELVSRDDLDPKSGIDLAQAMLSMGDWAHAADLLVSMRERFPNDYRFGYLYAVALEEDDKALPAVEAFVALLDADQEPVVSPARTQARRSRNQDLQLNLLRKVAPAGTVDLTMFQRYAYRAYRHRQRRGRRAGQSLSFVDIPRNLEALRGLALAHVSTLSRALDDDGVQDVRGLLSGAGVSYARYVLDLDLSSGFRRGIGPELLETYPDDEAILGFVLLNQMNSPGGLEVAHLQSALEVFRGKRVELAFMACMAAAFREEEEAKPLVREGLEMLDQLESPTYFSMVAALTAVGNSQFSRGAESQLSEVEKKLLMSKLTEWYSADGSSPWNQYLFVSIASGMVQSEDYAGFVTFLDDEVARSAAKGPNPQRSRSYGGRNSLLKPLEFPPAALASFPELVLGLLSPGRGRYGVPLTFQPEALLAEVDRVRSPLLKVLLLQTAETHGAEEGVAGRAIQELVSGKEPKLDVFLLAAAHAAGESGDPAAGVALLKRAQFLPMKREQRQMIDGSIVAWSLEGKSAAAAADDSLLATGREAALRLRRGHLSPEHRGELVAAMEELGMNKEAKKLEAQAARAVPAGPSRRTGFGLRSSGSGSRNSETQIQRLLSAGKREQAVRILQRDLKRFSQAALQIQSVFQNPYEARQWLEQISAQGLAREVLESADPGETTNPRRMAEWAYACELLGESEQAIAGYRKAAAARPRDAVLRLRWIGLLVRSDMAAARTMIDELETPDLAVLGERMDALAQEDEVPFSSRMELLEALIDTLPGRENLSRAPLYWVSNLLQQFAQQSYADGVDLGNVYEEEASYLTRNSGSDKVRKARGEELRALRRVTHDNICRSLLEVPALAREGFRRLSAFYPPDGSHDELAALAWKVLVAVDKSPANAGFGRSYYYSYGHNPAMLRMWLPEDYLVRNAWVLKDRTSIDSEVRPALAAMRGATAKQTLRVLDDRLDLFFCDEGEFLEVAERITKRSARAANPRQDQGLRTVVDAWSTRELDVDLSALVSETIQRTKGQGGRPGDALREYVLAQKARGGAGAVYASVEQIATLYFGPRERWGDQFKKHLGGNQRGGAVYTDLQSGLQVMRDLAQIPEIFFVVADYFEDHIAPELGAQRSNWRLQAREHPLLQGEAYKDFDSMRGQLEASPFLADGETLRVYMWQVESPQNCFLWRVASLISGTPPALKRRYLRFLEGKGTLGAALLVVLADSRPKSWHTFFEAHASTLRSKPDMRASVFLSAYVRSRSDGEFSNDSTTAETKATIAWLKGQQDEDVLGEIEALLAARSVQALGVQSHRLPREARRYFQVLLPEQREKAEQVLWKIVELMERENRSGRSRSSYGSGGVGGLVEYVVSRSFSGRENDLERLNFLYDLFSSENPLARSLSPQALGSLNLRSVFQREVEEFSQDATLEADQKRLARLMSTFAATVDAKYHRLATETYFSLLRAAVPSRDPERIAALLPWMDTQAKEGPHAELARELHFVAKLEAHAGDLDTTRPEDLAEETAYFVARLEEDELSLALRLDLACSIMARAGHVLPFAATARALRLAGEAWSSKLSIASSDLSRLTRNLLHERHAKDDAWRQATGEFLAHWKKNVLFKRDPNRNRPQPLNGQEVARMVRVCVYLSDDESMNQILARSVDAQDGSLLALLVREGKSEQIARLLAGGWAHMDWRVISSGEDVGPYDVALTHQLPAILEQIESPDLKIFLESFVASLPDPDLEDGAEEGGSEVAESTQNVSEEPGPTPRDERLLALAKRIESHEFQNPLQRDATLSFVIESKLAAQEVAEPLRQASAEIRPALFMQQRNGGLTAAQLHQKRKLFETYVSQSLAQGPEVVGELLDDLAKSTWSSSRYRVQATNQVLETFHSAFRDTAMEWPAALRKANVGVWTKLLRMDVSRAMTADQGFVRQVALGLLYTALEDDAALLEVFENGLDELDEGARKNLQESARFVDVILAELGSSVKKRELDKERRLRLVQAVHGNSLFAAATYRGEGSHRDVLRSLRDSNVVTDEEILEIGDALAEKAPRRGQTAAELAAVHARLKGFVAAAASYETALAQLPSDETRDYSRFHLARAQAFRDAEKPDDALASLRGLDRERLDAESESTYENLVLELELTSSVKAGNEREAIALASRGYLEAAEERRDEGEIARLGVALEALGAHFHKEGAQGKASAYLYLAAESFRLAEEEVSGAAGGRLEKVTDVLIETQSAQGKVVPPVDLVERGARWKYLDGGVRPGEAWRHVEFDDTDWKDGLAKFGYGDGNEKTTLDFGADPRKKAITAYFRRVFELASPRDARVATLRLLRDDGAVVYVNGQEVARDNLPGGEIDANTPAERTVSRADESRYFKQEQLDLSTLLVEGKNVVAVELHQTRGVSSDAGFDLDLRANVLTLEEVLETVDPGTIEATLGPDVWDEFPPEIIARLVGEKPAEAAPQEAPEADGDGEEGAGG